MLCKVYKTVHGYVLQLSAATFEVDFANWTNEINGVRDNQDWERKKGPTTSRETGPPTDHTFGTAQGNDFEGKLHR